MNDASRRRLLRGITVAVPAAWTAPRIESVLLPAHAQTTTLTSPPAPAVCSAQTLQAEDRTGSGGSIEATATRVILQSDGAYIEWDGVDLSGCSQLTVFYSNGEDPGDQLNFEFGGVPIGSSMSLVTFNAWDGPYTSVSTPIAGVSGTNTLRLVGTQLATGIWVASIDRIEIA